MRDFFYINSDGIAQKWARLTDDEIKTQLERLGDNHKGVFQTIQEFQDKEHKDLETYDCPFYIDLDGENAIDDIRAIVNYFVDDLGVPEDAISMAFSGNKGFHIVTNREVWGAVPNQDLVKQWKSLAHYLKKKLNLSTIDLAVYSKRRMFRIMNSLHKSGLYKIPIKRKELFLSIEKIRELAKQPKPVYAIVNSGKEDRASKIFELSCSFLRTN